MNWLPTDTPPNDGKWHLIYHATKDLVLLAKWSGTFWRSHIGPISPADVPLYVPIKKPQKVKV